MFGFKGRKWYTPNMQHESAIRCCELLPHHLLLPPPCPFPPVCPELIDAFGLVKLKGRKWHVQGAVATRGDGLYEGLDWLAANTVRV